jgi:MFS family permease
LGVAVVGQALIGIGCAPVFMGTLVVLARWYPPGRFATLGSLVLAGGNAGTLLGTTPLAVAAQTLGWRGAFLAFAVLVLLAAALVLALVRDAPPDAGAREGGTEQRLDQALRTLVAWPRTAGFGLSCR